MARKYDNKKHGSKNHANTDKKNNDGKAAEKFAEMMIARMEQMKADDWKKGWVGGEAFMGLPQNISGRTYSGSNSFLLQMDAAMNGYRTPVYMTFLQIQKEGAHVNKGATAMPVIYWNFTYQNKDGKYVSPKDYQNMTKEERDQCTAFPHLRYYNVFNIDQTNLKEVNKEKYDKIVAQFAAPEIKDAKGMYENAALDRLFEKQEWVCPIQVDQQSSSAYYSPSRDQIVVPMKEQFNIGKTPEEVYKDGMEFYSSALHEMAHSTGTPERLNRTKGDKFGDTKYAKEELVAELTAANVGYAMGFDKRILDNNAAYLDGWIDVLKKNPNFIISVMADVNKASSMVLEAVDKQRIALGQEPLVNREEQEANQKQQKTETPAQTMAPEEPTTTQNTIRTEETPNEQAMNTSNSYSPLADDTKMAVAEPSPTNTPAADAQTADVQSVAVSQQQDQANQQMLQQIEDFKNATGIQLEIRDNKPYYDDDLDLRGKNITKLPENLTVTGSLDLRETHVKELPENLTVGGALKLSNTPIKKLPEELSVNGWLDLDNTPIKELPEGLKVVGSLDLSNTPIKELPEGLSVKANLWLNNTSIERLPENLTVGGALFLQNTNLQQLPQNLTVGGSLYLTNSKIEKLPENLTVSGWLDLQNTPIKRLPEGLKVGDSLDLYGTEIKDLPADLKVKNNIYMTNRTIEATPNVLTPDGYIDLVKADAPIAQTQSSQQMTYPELLQEMMTQTKIPVVALPDGIRIDNEDGTLMINQLNEGTDFKEFSSLPRERQDYLAWSASEILLASLENRAKKMAKDAPDEISVDLPNGQTVSFNDKGQLQNYDQLTKLEKIDVLNAFADYAKDYAKNLFDNATKNSEDNKLYLQPNNWIQKEDDGSLSIVLIKDNQTNKESLDHINGLTQWSIVSFAIEDTQTLKQKQQTAQTQISSPEMENAKTPEENAIMRMTSIAANTPKDRPSDIVFVRDINPDNLQTTYTAYGKDADRLAEKISSSVATMRPEIEGQRYPNATVNSGNIEAVRIDLMANNVHPVIIDTNGHRIDHDNRLAFTKEERKAYLYSQTEEGMKKDIREEINKTLQDLGSPERIKIPNTSERFGYDQSLMIPQRFGYQEVALTEIKRSKNGSYSAGNDENGYYPINKMDSNNLSEVQQALKKVVANRPENLVKELVNQVNSGKAEVSHDTAKDRYIININDQPGERNYPRGFKQFTVGADMQDHVLLHDDRGGSRTGMIKVDPKTLQQLVNYAESKLGITQTQKNTQWTDFNIQARQDKYFISAKVNGNKLPERQISIDDFKAYKTDKTSDEQLIHKYYNNNELNPKQSQNRGLKR